MKHTVTELKLKNGSRGLFIDIADASVMTFEINFRAGDFLAPKSKWETAHLMEHVLLGANKQIPRARDFQAEFEKNGAYCNASTSTYDIIYEAECADFEWDRIADLLLTAVTKPLFLPDEFTAEFGNVRDELVARSNNHFRHLSLALREKFGFCALTDQQRLELMDNVTVDDVRKHYLKTHTTKNMRFVVAGKLTPARQKQLRELFETIELPLGEQRISLPEETPKKLAKALYINNDTVENLHFYLDTFMKRRLTDPEADALNTINIILTETLYSRILGTARERGLIYSMSSGFGQSKDVTNWWFGAQVLSKNSRAIFDIMAHELNSVFQDKLSDEDLTAAKQYALGRYQRSGQTVGGVAAGYSGRYFFDDVIEDYYELPDRIKAVTKPAIGDVSRAMFAESLWGLGVLGSCGHQFVDELRDQIKSLWQ